MHSPFRRAFFSQPAMEQILPPPCLMQNPLPRSLDEHPSSLQRRLPPWLWHRLLRCETRSQPSILQYLEARLRWVPLE